MMARLCRRPGVGDAGKRDFTRPNACPGAKLQLMSRCEWRGKGANARPRSVVFINYEANTNCPLIYPLVAINDREARVRT